MTKRIFFLMFQQTPFHFFSDNIFKKETSLILIGSEHPFLDSIDRYYQS